MSMALGLVRFLSLLAQICFGVWLFSSRLLARRFGLALAAVVLLPFWVFLYAIATELDTSQGISPLYQLVVFSVFLLTCILLVLARRKTTPLTALFCATAGYTTQNLASGLDGMVKLLALELWGIPEENMWLWTPSFILCTLAVYVPVYLLFVRRVREVDLERARHRGMAGVLAVVLLVVIFFDVINKMLPGYGVPLAMVCGSRLVHGVMCAFVLYAEYEMVFNRQLALDKATTEQVLEERGRQYELSRETISAVNRRMHDIRHAVARTLDAAQVDRATLVEVTREVDVFDAHLRTGNEALDTVLTEKGLVCARKGITLTSIADGTLVSFMDAADVYALVGGLIDAAIDSARLIEDGGFKTISISLREVAGMAAISVESFTPSGEPPSADAVEKLADRYGAIVSRTVENGILMQSVALPR